MDSPKECPGHRCVTTWQSLTGSLGLSGASGSCCHASASVSFPLGLCPRRPFSTRWMWVGARAAGEGAELGAAGHCAQGPKLCRACAGGRYPVHSQELAHRDRGPNQTCSHLPWAARVNQPVAFEPQLSLEIKTKQGKSSQQAHLFSFPILNPICFGDSPCLSRPHGQCRSSSDHGRGLHTLP